MDFPEAFKEYLKPIIEKNRTELTLMYAQNAEVAGDFEDATNLYLLYFLELKRSER